MRGKMTHPPVTSAAHEAFISCNEGFLRPLWETHALARRPRPSRWLSGFGLPEATLRLLLFKPLLKLTGNLDFFVSVFHLKSVSFPPMTLLYWTRGALNQLEKPGDQLLQTWLNLVEIVKSTQLNKLLEDPLLHALPFCNGNQLERETHGTRLFLRWCPCLVYFPPLIVITGSCPVFFCSCPVFFCGVKPVACFFKTNQRMYVIYPA